MSKMFYQDSTGSTHRPTRPSHSATLNTLHVPRIHSSLASFSLSSVIWGAPRS
eukprot:gene3850-4447_t